MNIRIFYKQTSQYNHW